MLLLLSCSLCHLKLPLVDFSVNISLYFKLKMERRRIKTLILKEEVNIKHYLSYQVGGKKNRVYAETDLKEGINLEEEQKGL